MVKIKIEQNMVYTNEYLIDRNKFWDEKIIEYNKQKIPLWNGRVYFVNYFKDNILSINLLEYKDLLFVQEQGIKFIKTKYGIKFDFIYINVQILLENEKEFLFGTISKNDFIEIVSVGGTLRMEDKKEILNFNDIQQYAKKEMLIETKIDIKEGLCCTNLPPNHKKTIIGYFLFIFTSKFLKVY